MFHFQFHTYKLIFMYNCPCFSLPSFSFASISTLYTDRSVNYSIEFRTSVALKLASSFCLILFFSSQLPFLVHLARPSCWSVHPGLRARPSNINVNTIIIIIVVVIMVIVNINNINGLNLWIYCILHLFFSCFLWKFFRVQKCSKALKA